jgi:predicted RNA-binding protein with PIN domain
LTIWAVFTRMEAMPYLIDGHNLIPKVPGLSLDAVDDENQLVQLLQEFCRISRRQVDVYFDLAPAGQSGKRKLGTVAVHFVRAGGTADQAIAQRLRKMGRSARNWTVVSSDLQVQASARQAGAQALSSESFASLLMAMLSQTTASETKPGDAGLSPEEIEEWLALFRSKKKDSP